jgi:hypothetical protein
MASDQRCDAGVKAHEPGLDAKAQGVVLAMICATEREPTDSIATEQISGYYHCLSGARTA